MYTLQRRYATMGKMFLHPQTMNIGELAVKQWSCSKVCHYQTF